MSAANISQTVAAIDAAAKQSGFRCVPVSWEDAQRGTVAGQLSCWGGNISDVRLWEKTGTLLYTLRSQNWNERLGYVAAKDVAVVTGNTVAGGSQPTPCTLATYLRGLGGHAAYAGVDKGLSLFTPEVDSILSVRFQTVFLPIADRETVEFCTEVYNYNTQDDADPRNLLLLCTPQGTSVQQDGAGAKRVYFHEVDPVGQAHRYWLEAERSSHKVGGAQVEDKEEAADAAQRGKATAIRIGTRAMGTRFNVQMLVQLPLKQKQRRHEPSTQGLFFFSGPQAAACGPEPECASDDEDDDEVCMLDCARVFGCSAPLAVWAVGVSNAARVSRGTEVDVYPGLAHAALERGAGQHGTITVTMYYTVAGGVPSEADVQSAIRDLEELYQACPSDKRLVDCTEVTAELTVADMQDIKEKVTVQPYVPRKFAPTPDAGFPDDL
jgi:huntingtin|uniref:Uncharacterized protein n=1 Tax=Eutreptiella gymnastica TaxID=73025 RepID=A0A7S4LE07_9EUGL|eukprot:CAMPEP_0174287758 /NCGR_PEP_ID=MMETSP0809-20121228/17438_1 /TAXON_ID=73025 ORGANISM="Eutreptiella gymnastica-like, Strain CCMP1594" /NCGR_SAMPLE_ID=MMETSP0809 /ASSEMBLY_ACC=CAM_ASM_000658 /LENGTH=436 /DNA_ID=CAMNT_0015384493 /DNA_START=25 /DNA_END=1335 /DNA_ORIENTATION=+